MHTRAEIRELLETGTVRRTKVRSQKSKVESQKPEVETLPRATRAVRVVSGRHRDRVAYLVIPERVAGEVIATGTLQVLAGIEGVMRSPYLPAGCAVVRTIQD